jgi:TM2 domain-containing membrane protein YozV
MQGQVLAYDFRTAQGEISGADGQRYDFGGGEWKSEAQPRAGQRVDFKIEGSSALGVYLVAASSSQSSRTIAGLLAILLAGLGLHKFYLGYHGTGAIMLAASLIGLAMAFIPTIIIVIISLIEGVNYLSMSDSEFEERYVHGNKNWF